MRLRELMHTGHQELCCNNEQHEAGDREKSSQVNLHTALEEGNPQPDGQTEAGQAAHEVQQLAGAK